MTSLTLKRQIDRAKAELDGMKPKPPATIKMLTDPGPGADAATRASFGAALEEAKRTHDKVFVVTGQEERLDQDAKVQCFENDFTAMLALVASQPSKQGKKSLLDDVMADVLKSGKTWGVNSDPLDVHPIEPFEHDERG